VSADLLATFFALWWLLDVGESWAPVNEVPPTKLQWERRGGHARVLICVRCRWEYRDEIEVGGQKIRQPPEYVMNGCEYVSIGSAP